MAKIEAKNGTQNWRLKILNAIADTLKMQHKEDEAKKVKKT